MSSIVALIDMPVEMDGLEALKADGRFALRFPETVADVKRPLPESLIRNVEIMFTTHLPENHQCMERLKFVQLESVGYAQLYNHNLVERHIRAANAIGVQDRPIAEWNVAMMVNLKRDVKRMLANQRNAVWDRDPLFQQEIGSLTVGIWGYGGIGQQTARLAKAFGMKVHAMTLDGRLENRANFYRMADTGDPEGRFANRMFSPAQKEEFLRDLDFLVMAIPLTPKNTGIVGAAELALLPKRAFVLNPARGPLIQEQALVDALKNGVIAGAALDTHYQYPLPPDHPLWRMENVILTPHISGSSSSSHFLPRIWDIFSQNAARYAAGEPLLNELSAAQLSGN